jgi:hypothetical protein
MEVQKSNIEQVLNLNIEGEINFIGNPHSSFNGPIKKGLRLVLWGNSSKQATSCAFIKGVEIQVGEKANWEIIILSPQSIDKEIKVGETYSIGNPGIKLCDFKVTKINGMWDGKSNKDF